MANRIHNASMTLDEILEEPETRPIAGGEPTPEEKAAAFDELFKETWRRNA